MSRITMIGAPDPVLGFDGARIYGSEAAAEGRPPPAQLEGAVACLQPLAEGGARIVRDRLGLGKLFWARGAGGELVFAPRPADLVRAGYRFADIASVPRGQVIALDARGEIASRGAVRPAGPVPRVAGDVGAAGEAIRQGLDGYLAALSAAYPDRRAYLCLSGGLDSSTVAVLASRYFPKLTAVSFDLAHADGEASEDRVVAERLAADLGIRVLEATVTPDTLLSYLDLVLVAGIDWRDFNVHCALVNAALAAAIDADRARDDEPPIVITGDLPNELLVDYEAETYKGSTYYALPRIERSILRRVLVDGLDSCHREVGVFSAFGLVTAQPYAACVDAYLGLPADFLAREDRKERLVEAIVGDELPGYIYRRPKVRAQIGDSRGGGTLATCIDRGIDGRWLRRRFAEIHEAGGDEALDGFIRAGRYRSAVPAAAKETYGHG